MEDPYVAVVRATAGPAQDPGGPDYFDPDPGMRAIESGPDGHPRP